MTSCPNCGAQITCGCQQRVASNGANVCQNCVAMYEQSLVQAKTFDQTLQEAKAYFNNEKSSS